MKKLFIAVLSLIFFLSACGTSATPTPTPVPATELPPTVAASPTATAITTSSPTDATASPTGSAASSSTCTNLASFEYDKTVPDYSHMDPHDVFTKTWRVKNTGTCTWSSSYMAVYAGGDHLGIKDSVALNDTAPGASLDISIDMAAPGPAGTYKVFYELKDPSGNAMTIDSGNTIWAIITVGKVLVYSTALPAAISGTPNATPVGGGPTPAGCVTQANASFISQTQDLINAARASSGLPPLTANSQLAAAAQAHSVDMACTGSLSHTGSDNSTPDSRIAAAGYKASITRENIYAQPPQYGGNPQAAMSWWMSDPIHRDAILNPQVTQVGVGYAAYSPSPLGGYFTVDFGAP